MNALAISKNVWEVDYGNCVLLTRVKNFQMKSQSIEKNRLSTKIIDTLQNYGMALEITLIH